MLKRLFSFAMIVCCFTVVAMGQTTFEQSQSRTIGSRNQDYEQ